MGLRAVKIDTLGLAKELENAGIPRPQAEAQIQTTIKVIDMAIEEKLVTKHDLTRALKHTEDKLLTEISKLHEADEKLSMKIDRVEEKLSARMDRIDEKFSAEITAGRKETQELKDKVTHIECKINQLSSTLTIRLSSILGGAMTIGFTILALLIKFH